MFNEFIFKLKKSKLLLGKAIFCAIIFLVDIALLVFDIVELIIISNNSVKLSASFLGFNIAVAVLNFVALAIVITLLIIKKFSLLNSSKNSQKR